MKARLLKYPVLLLLLTVGLLPAQTAHAVDPRTSRHAADFQTQILPLLTRLGCNSGACHGAAAGRGEFRLSLFAADPDADLHAMTVERHSRRINLARPELSLLLKKACGQLNHGGGQILEPTSSETQLLLDWIRNGATSSATRTNCTLQITPPDFHAAHVPASTPLQITATFSDGSSLDVTQFCRITSTDTSAVTVSDDNVATILRPGQHHIIIRYLDQTQMLRLQSPFSSMPPASTPSSALDLIDQHVQLTLHQLGLPAAAPATSEVWIRRLYLQLSGTLPVPSMVLQLAANDTPDLRRRMIDDLFDSPAFTDYWTLQLAQLLQLHSLPNEPEAFTASAEWLRQAVAADQPLDEIVRQILLANGDSHTNGAAGFSRMTADARSQAEFVGQAFAGISLGCANCHNHPLDRWTQDDFHGFAAIFAPIDRGRIVRFTGRGDVTNLRTSEPAAPRIPGLQYLDRKGDHRAAVAAWLTSGTSPPLAQNLVNRLWKHLFGQGLIEPVNDLSLTNPATHPELLQALTSELIRDHWSLRAILRKMVLSEAWGRSSVKPGTVASNPSPEAALHTAEIRFLARRCVLPMPPEILADAVADVLGVPLELSPQTAVRAVHVLDPARPAADLDVLGRCRRMNGCVLSNPQTELPLAAQLHLLNGSLINSRITAPTSRLQQMLLAGQTDSEIITCCTLHALSRNPTPAELLTWQQQLSSNNPAERRQQLEDFFWSLLNSQEFRSIP